MVEILIVLGVLGLTLAASSPFFMGYMNSRGIDESLNDLASQIDLARSRAIAENNRFRILFDTPDARQFEIHDDDDGDGAVDGAEALYGPYILSGTVAFSALELGGEQILVFEPSGMLSAGQGGRIVLTDGSGRARTLEVYASGTTAQPAEHY